MDFDVLYGEVGELGLVQKYIVFLCVLPSVYTAFLFMGTFFLFQIPKHRCAIPGYANDTFAVQGDFHQLLINRTIPLPSDKTLPYDECHVFPAAVEYDEDNHPINGTPMSCDLWVYDDSMFEETLGAKMNIVCDRKVYKSNAQMVLFAGLLMGSFVTGVLSDRFGRKMVTCVSAMLLVAAATALSWTPNYIFYVCVNFFIGVFAVGVFMPIFVLSMEFVGPRKRKFAGLLTSYFWATGSLFVAWMGYSIRHWHRLQLACAIPGIFFVSYWWILPESPRWLFSVGRFKESEAIINRTAKYNKRTLPSGFFDKLRQNRSEEPTGKLWHLFSSKTLCIRTLVIFFNWIVVCLAYYGLALNSANFGGDLFLNFALSAMMDIPATTVVLLLIDRTGRKPLHVTCMLIGGVACITTVFTMHFGGTDLETATITMAMIGKAGASAGFSIIYVYSAELFPTQVRNAGMGASSCMARIGGMISPYIADMSNLVGDKRFGKVLPMIILGVLSVAAGLLTLLLPETLNRHLPETIKDAINMDSQRPTDLEKGEAELHVNQGFKGSESVPTSHKEG